MKCIVSLRVLIPALFLLLVPLALTASAAENTGAKDEVSSHAKGDQGEHGEEKSGGLPLGFLILIVLVGVLAVAPAYHRMNVGDGDGDHTDAGAH